MPPWVWVALAAAGLWAVAQRKPKAANAGSPPTASGNAGGLVSDARKAQSGSLSKYIDKLYQVQLALLPVFKAHYNKDRLRRIARAAAGYYAIPPEWVWGTLYGESAWTPVGVYGHDPEKAKAIPSNAYGMGQFLGSRYDWEKQHRPEHLKWSHVDLIDPRLTIWTTAASFNRGVRGRGGFPTAASIRTAADLAKQVAAVDAFSREKSGLQVGHWWAGSSVAGATKKTGHVKTKGPDVRVEGPGATSDDDDLPPSGWGASWGVVDYANIPDPLSGSGGLAIGPGQVAMGGLQGTVDLDAVIVDGLPCSAWGSERHMLDCAQAADEVDRYGS